jgi:hypothetical protein
MRPVTLLAAVLLAAVAAAHLLRLALGVEVTVEGARVPMWVSVIGCLLPAALAVGLWQEGRCRTGAGPR